jgi:hypothetical protein
VPGVEGVGGDQRVAEIGPAGDAFRAPAPRPLGAISSSIVRRNVAKSNGFLSVDCAISLIYALLPMARRQREWQATTDQGLDELIVSPVPKMRLTPTIAISPIETEGPQLDRGRTGQLRDVFSGC